MRFDKQGEKANAQPHLLTAYLDLDSFAGVTWRVTCPYTGPKECGMVEECRGTSRDVEKWGCEPYPSAPDIRSLQNPDGTWSAVANDEVWDAFHKARDRWVDEIHDGNEFHRTQACWYEEAISSGDYEAEYFLSAFPREYVIVSPIKVMVGYEGYADECEPVLKLWEEPTDDQS